MERTRGFTLVELLLVVGIIALLASMLMVGLPYMLFIAKALDTEQRMQAVMNAIQLTAHAEGDTAYAVQRSGMHDDLTWVSLRTVLERAKAQGTLASKPDDIPPNMKLRFAGPAQMHSADMRIDNQVCWLLRDSTGTLVKPGGWQVGAADFYSDSQWNPLPSRIGESLDLTLEVGPDQQKQTAWYLTRWPTLLETGTAPNLVQTSWPKSDWDKAVPGTVPPCWSSPWGRPLMSRTGELIDKQYEPHSLDQLSPLSTIGLLQMAGILQPGAVGEDAYRTDRGKNRTWNDRWGNPLIVSAALFIPPRYDFATRPDGTAEESIDLRGGRDYLLKKAKQNYGFSRAVYLTVGAVGPVVRTPASSPWAAADDAANLRTEWLQICDVTEASRWDETSFSKPAWSSSVKRGKKAGERCFVTAPVEAK